MKPRSLLEAKVPVQIVLGETDLSVKEISELAVGSIVGVESIAGEPVSFVAAGEEIAKGEVVIIDENFGIRITSIPAKKP